MQCCPNVCSFLKDLRINWPFSAEFQHHGQQPGYLGAALQAFFVCVEKQTTALSLMRQRGNTHSDTFQSGDLNSPIQGDITGFATDLWLGDARQGSTVANLLEHARRRSISGALVAPVSSFSFPT